MELLIEPLEQALQGDRMATEALSTWCLQRAFRFAYVDLGPALNREAIAEEIAGEASLKAVTHLDQFRAGTRFEAWLHQIVRNCACDYFRQQDRAVPRSLYQRWVHDFLQANTPEIEVLIQQEFGQEPTGPHPVLLQRITTDLSDCTYRQFMRLSYDGRENVVLDTVQQRLRAFVGLEWLPFYEWDGTGEWIEIELPGADETEAQVLHHEFIEHVNEHLADLLPLCRRLLRWYYLDRLPIVDIARVERLSERTAYRRLEGCSNSFRARLTRDGYFADYTDKDRSVV
jgi:RNA polymerase sigma factor (sigma-70 family)